MRNTKYILPSFAFYDRTGIEKYLEKKAEKGWMLENAGNFAWKFRRITPGKRTFAVVYFSGADLYDPAPSEAEETFREFCAHSGWILAGSNAQMQIFYSDRENPTPIETDPVLEGDNIHKSMRKSVLPASWILLLSCVLQCCAQWISIRSNPLRYLSSEIDLFFGVICPLMSMAALSRLICYYIWRRKAKSAARRDGTFLETRSVVWIENLVSVVVLLGLPFAIVTLKDRNKAIVMGLCMMVTFAVIILVEYLRRKLKKAGFDAAENKKLTMLASLAMFMVLMLAIVPAVSGFLMDHQAPEDGAGLRLNIWELREEQAQDYKTMRLTDQESELLGYWQVHQYPQGSRITPSLQYNLLEVKAPFLYQKCLDEIMIIPVYMEHGAFHKIDPAPWGADQAWQLHDGEENREWYVLCYQDLILEIIPDWTLTETQKNKVGDLFN